MRRILALTVVAAALAVAGVAAAAPGGAEVVNQSWCSPFAFGTVCTTVKATTNVVATPSGNLSYVTNGTVERTQTFFFGGSYTTSSDIHLKTLQKNGELHVVSERSSQSSSYRSGTFALDCTGTIVSHYANGTTQFADYSYVCTIP